MSSAHNSPSLLLTTFLVVDKDKGLMYLAALPSYFFFSCSSY